MRLILGLLALLAALSPSLANAAARDWSRMAARAPSGAYVYGNPKAKVKLVEYLSMTCSHCAHFSAEAWKPLKANYVAKGLVSLEVRHAIRDGYDLAASLLARCGGAKDFLGATEMVMAGQEQWLAKVADLPQDDIEQKPIDARLAAMAQVSGLDAMFVRRGLTPARITACLASSTEQKRLAAMADEAWNKRKIGGTPAFLINDRLQPDISTWSALEPLIKAALK